MIRFGTVPILWNNDDLPGERRIPYREILDAIARNGYDGTELGSDYPRDPAVLTAALRERGLTLSGAYFCPGLTDPAGVPVALDQAEELLALLEAVGCGFLIVAEPLVPERAVGAGCVGMPPGAVGEAPALPGAPIGEAPAQPGAPIGDSPALPAAPIGVMPALPAVPTLPDAGWETLARALGELSRRAGRHGIRVAFHNHAGTWVETPGEVARLLASCDVDLCLDTGHWTFCGGDAVEAVRRHLPRMSYLHLKDVDPAVLATVRAEGLGFLDALRRCVFTELGAGCVDVAAIAGLLRDAGWSGWVVSEQDTTTLQPCEASRRSRAFLASVFEGAAIGEALAR